MYSPSVFFSLVQADLCLCWLRFFLYKIFLRVSILPTYVFITWRPEEGLRFPGTGVANPWGLPCGCLYLHWVLPKSSTYSYQLSHLSSPYGEVIIHWSHSLVIIKGRPMEVEGNRNVFTFLVFQLFLGICWWREHLGLCSSIVYFSLGLYNPLC